MSVQSLYPSQVVPFLRTADYASWSDSQLIEACQERNHLAFQCLRKRHLGLVRAALYRLAPEKTDNDDVMQEIFLRVWHSIRAIREPSAFRAWLKQIVTNCFYDELRRRPDKSLVYIDCPLSTENGNDSSFTQITDQAARPDELAESSELSEEIRSGLVLLAPGTRRLILLRMDGLSYGEIAQVTNTELGTVKSRLSRARLKLKSMMNLGKNVHPTLSCLPQKIA